MAENLMNTANKATNDRYRGKYDAVFGRRCLKCRKLDDKCRCDGKNGGETRTLIRKVK